MKQNWRKWKEICLRAPNVISFFVYFSILSNVFLFFLFFKFFSVLEGNWISNWRNIQLAIHKMLFSIMFLLCLIIFVMFNDLYIFWQLPLFFLDCKYDCFFVTIWYYLFLSQFIMYYHCLLFSRFDYDPSWLDSLFS